MENDTEILDKVLSSNDLDTTVGGLGRKRPISTLSHAEKKLAKVINLYEQGKVSEKFCYCMTHMLSAWKEIKKTSAIEEIENRLTKVEGRNNGTSSL